MNYQIYHGDKVFNAEINFFDLYGFRILYSEHLLSDGLCMDLAFHANLSSPLTAMSRK